jgi:hypothetical protein
MCLEAISGNLVRLRTTSIHILTKLCFGVGYIDNKI